MLLTPLLFQSYYDLLIVGGHYIYYRMLWLICQEEKPQKFQRYTLKCF
nr:MAG TPA: hypothetical protein [Caudoviricetes sp.]